MNTFSAMSNLLKKLPVEPKFSVFFLNHFLDFGWQIWKYSPSCKDLDVVNYIGMLNLQHEAKRRFFVFTRKK